jgi:fluoroquinolone transport system permease protein
VSRLAATFWLDLRLQLRYGFYYAGAFVTLVWISLLLPLPAAVLEPALPLVVFADLAVVGYVFIAGAVLFEKGERTLFALLSTPLRFREYLAAKLGTLTALAGAMTLAVVVPVYGTGFDPVLLVAGVVLTSLISLFIGFVVVVPFDSISAYLIPSQLPMVILALPLIYFYGVWESPLFYLLPTHGCLLLLGGAFDPGSLAAWQLAYAGLYGLAWVAGLSLLARRAFERYVVVREGRR